MGSFSAPIVCPVFIGRIAERDALYRLRGKAYETLGEFERALSDYEHTLEAARAAQDRLMEWQSLVAVGFLLREHFVQAVLQTLQSEKPSPSRGMAAEKYDGLTEREIEVLRFVAQWLTDIQVAERPVISPRTVHSHPNSIYSKLAITSRSAATRYAIEHNLA